MQGSIPTKLTLTRWAQLMGMHPLHIMQVRLNSNDTDPHCSHIYFKYAWQTADHVGRDEIIEAIAESEAKIEAALGYHLAPTWEVDEWRPTTRYYKSELVNVFASDPRGYRNTIKANWGYFISGGIEAKTLIDAAAPIVYTDSNSDNYDETATVTVVTDVTDPREIAIYYPGKGADDRWEIRPTEVSISGGNAVITFRRELVVVEDLIEAFNIEGGEAIGSDDNDFLEEVDVYRHWNDPSTQVSFLWEPLAGSNCASCFGAGCASCAFATQTGCLVLRTEPRQSVLAFHPADWDAEEEEFTSAGWGVGREPDLARLYYYSGWQDKRLRYNNRMDPNWERAVAYMAAALLDRPPCDCAKGDWIKWRQDLTIVAGDEDGLPRFRDPQGNLDNPFGTRRGEVYAWRKVKSLIIGQAVLV